MHIQPMLKTRTNYKLHLNNSQEIYKIRRLNNLYFLLRQCKRFLTKTYRTGNINIKTVRYAADIIVLIKGEHGLKKIIHRYNSHTEKYNHKNLLKEQNLWL